MKDFDAEFAERDSIERRTFQLRGETFVRKIAVSPEWWMGYDTRLTAAVAEGEQHVLAVMDEQILASIEPDDNAHDRYRALRAAEHTQVGLPEITTVISWLNEELAQRPTKAPGSSGNGRATSGTRSTGRSSSAAAAG